MKSMEDRARELINPLDLGCEALRDKIVKIFIQALKEEQKIIRHACAEAVNNIPGFMVEMGERTIRNLISKTAAHQAIMNVNIEKGDE